ncbi:MAG: hypothetical protein IJ281_06545 [Clostridia bacterium]|nr:hypothetical protein [Clostridia bacterium]
MEHSLTSPGTDLFPDRTPCREDYFTELLAEALRCGRIPEEKEMHVRKQVMDLLAERILFFTKGESTSVRAETAQTILASILYSVSAELLRTGSHDAALAMLTEQSISVLHESGMAHLMHTKTRAELLSLLLLRTQKSGMSRGYDQFVGRDAYRYVRSYNALYSAAEELYVQIPEMGIREICRGILRVTEIMTQVLKFNRC